MTKVPGRWLRQAVAAADTWSRVETELRRAPSTHPSAKWHGVAFDYFLNYREGVQQPHPFYPMVVWADGTASAPRLPDDVPSEAREHWAAAARQIAHPLLRSRYGDLLWVCRHPRPDQWARMAVEAYLKVIKIASDGATIVDGSRRAIELALELRDEDLARKAIRQVVTLTARHLGRPDCPPGIGLGLLEELIRPPAAYWPTPLSPLTDRAEELFGGQHFDAIADVRVRLEPERQSEIREEQLTRQIAKATAQSGLARTAFLREARELADQYGLRHRIPEIERLAQETEMRDSFHEISAEVKIPTEKLRQFLDSLVGDSDYVGFLTRLGAGPPHSGEFDEVHAQVQDLMAKHPFQFLVSRMYVGDEDVVLATPRDDAETLEIEIVKAEYQRIQFAAVLLGMAIKEAETKFGLPDTDELVTAFTTSFIGEDDARVIAKAILLHHQGDYESAAHLLTPKVERTIRHLARELGVVTNELPAGPRRGRVRGLGHILSEMRGRWPEAYHRYFSNLLVDQIGANLRNRIAHGLIEKVAEGDSALLIDAIARFRLMQIQKAGEGP